VSEEDAIVEALEARVRLERLAVRLTVAFSIWALVVLAVGAGVMGVLRGLSIDMRTQNENFQAFVQRNTERIALLESQDRISNLERAANREQIESLRAQIDDCLKTSGKR
jgi:hypothetical protein